MYLNQAQFQEGKPRSLQQPSMVGKQVATTEASPSLTSS
ncbi:unnamed protein product [Linum tenue]|uniref:Uncharacterized protein n=1 Tax=Linum tenue TaxID=586396 RepID=A0AAV0NUZ5_9ROSI|nr:unnamed protein product [Linum tenue]